MGRTPAVKKMSGVLALLALAGIVWLGYGSWRLRQENARGAANKIVRSPDLGALLDTRPEDLADAVGLAVRGIDLAQGGDGREIWRLRAEWGVLRRESGTVEVRAPRVRYILDETGEPEKSGYVLAGSDMGRVEDNNRLIGMRGNVLARNGERTLEGPLAVFDSDSRVLAFPQGGVLSDAALSGKGGILRWNMTTNILEGERGVEVIWTPPSPSGDPLRGAAPDKPDG
jgi:hypothetical protein